MQQAMFDELVQGLLGILAEQTVQIVLYGSTARGTAAPDSDIDIAIFLTRKPDARQEDQLSSVIAELNLKYNKVFSVVDIDQETYQKWRSVAPFYMNVEKEGVVLWKAA